MLAVRQDEDVALLRVVEGVDDVRLGRAEAPREGQELTGLEPLALDGQDLPFEERLLDVAESGVGERLRQIDALESDTEDIGQPALGQHGCFLTSGSRARAAAAGTGRSRGR
jgi:hypothetical protein